MRALEAIEAGRRRRVRPRDDGRHERAARAPRRAHRARHHRGLPRRDRDRPPGPPVALRPRRAAARSRSCRGSCASRCAERMGPEGELEPLDEDSLAAAVEALREAEVEAVAVCLLFAFLHPEHEQQVGEAVREALPGRPRLALERGAARVPRVRALLDHRGRRLPRARSSAAYLARLGGRRRRRGRAGAAGHAVLGRRASTSSAAARRRAGCVLSGPGRRRGRRGARGAGERLRGRAHLRHGRHQHRRRAGARRRGAARRPSRSSPASRSSCRWSTSTPSAPAAARSPGPTPGGALRVGPRSAGADPGPAAYGKGGEEPTVTDANLLLGYLARRRGARRRADAVGRERGRGARSAGSASELGLDALETAARRRARGQRRDGAARCG